MFSLPRDEDHIFLLGRTRDFDLGCADRMIQPPGFQRAIAANVFDLFAARGKHESQRHRLWEFRLDGKHFRLAVPLVFDEEVRDTLLESDPNEVTGMTRKLVRQRGQLMTQDAKEKFEQGLISDRVYKLILAGTKDYQR